MNTSGLFKLSWRDLLTGLVMSVVAVLITYFTSPGVDLSHPDWAYILRVVLTCALSFFSTQLVHDDKGKLGGVL